MPLKGINLGPGTTKTKLNSDHWWFLQWEQKGDAALVRAIARPWSAVPLLR
eukprot:SAG11_NODE_20081_length_453_cov_0.870056_1_plen_51_part_00